MSAAGGIPYVIGQWVRGSRFYGRRLLLERVLAGGWHWVAGLRRVGKTSLLKQLELLAETGTPRTVPLFWDLQGVDGPGELALTFADALLDAEELLAAAGVGIETLDTAALGAESVDPPPLLPILDRLVAAAKTAKIELLLLVDEADELLVVERQNPGFVERLWRALAEAGGLRVVLATALPLADQAAAGAPEAAWIRIFGEPLHLGVLEPEEARSLLRQDHRLVSSRPEWSEAEVETLRTSCGDHPMLLQLAAKRGLELGSAEAARAHLVTDRSVDHLFAVDLEL
ncbi:MAG: hypothetical protein KDD11_16830, partial [Acidobacteria bacterium]|nr:hypothetical protein [Acidobacteriota bacterium]